MSLRTRREFLVHCRRSRPRPAERRGVLRQADLLAERFTTNNVQHPTYKALAERGKAVKMVFPCRYLHDEGLRREIDEELNVIEQWKNVNDFVFFARRGELSSNRREDHRVSMLALYLLQN
jgi:TnpA family transposase